MKKVEIIEVWELGQIEATKIDGSYTMDDGSILEELAIGEDGALLAYDNGCNSWVMIWHDANALGFYID